MKRKNVILLMSILIPILTIGQELKSHLFLRTPQVVTYNFNQEKTAYSQVLSIGTSLSYKNKFIALATFITAEDVYGFYTFFGTTLKTRKLNEKWSFHTNWFGEISYLPKQYLKSDSFTYTSGFCFLLNRNFNWGSIGLLLCAGLAYTQKTISLTTRTILNISLKLN